MMNSYSAHYCVINTGTLFIFPTYLLWGALARYALQGQKPTSAEKPITEEYKAGISFYLHEFPK